jgi:TrkA domain protein
MSFELTRAPLPGVGVRYSFPTAHGGRLAIVHHDDGLCELYYFAREGAEDPKVVIRLESHEARQAGAVMGGAYDRPKIIDELEIAFGELVIEWVSVPDRSPLIGKTIAECAVRKRTGITIIAVVRDPHPVTGAQPSDTIEGGDTLVTVGRVEQYPAFRRLLAEGAAEP